MAVAVNVSIVVRGARRKITPATTVDHLWSIADRLGLEIDRDRGYGHGKLVEELWEHTVGHGLGATFVGTSRWRPTPLTREHRSVEGVTEKWDLYVRGFELATGYSNLSTPSCNGKIRGPGRRRAPATTRPWRLMGTFWRQWVRDAPDDRYRYGD